jgi:hypothetical protein
VKPGDIVSMVQHTSHRELWHTQGRASQRIGVDHQHPDARVAEGSPHIQDYRVLAADDPAVERASHAIRLDNARVLVQQGDRYVQHADVSLGTDFDAMVYSDVNPARSRAMTEDADEYGDSL